MFVGEELAANLALVRGNLAAFQPHVPRQGVLPPIHFGTVRTGKDQFTVDGQVELLQILRI